MDFRSRFGILFDVADELDGGLELSDLNDEFVKVARETATEVGASWPPSLGEVEEIANDLRRERRI